MKRLLSDIPQQYILNEVLLTPLKRSHHAPHISQLNSTLLGPQAPPQVNNYGFG